MAINKQKVLKNAAKFTKKGQYEKAVIEYRKLTQQDYGDSSLANVIGDLLIQAKNTQGAIIEYEKAGQFYEEKGFIPKALAIYKKILRYDPSFSRIYEKLAQLYSDQGLIQDAITQYEFLAKHYEHEGKTEEALDAYRQIADLDPSNLSIRERLATLYSQQGFKEKACAERVKVGERYVKRGDTITAIKNFEMALNDMPNDETALRGIVSVHLAEKRKDDAIAILNQILEKAPNNISALSTLGRVYMDSGLLDDAIEVFNKVFQLDPSQEGINEILGRIYILKGNYPEAFKLLKEIISVAIEREEYDRALGILNQLQEIEPKNILVREKKIEIYQKLNRDDELKATFTDLAEIYYEKGRLEEAYNIYERLFSMDPHNNSIKQRFNQISIELRGRPIEIDKLVEQPKFDSVLEETAVEEEDFLEIEPDTFSLEEGGNTLESLFDTTEIEKITIPLFGEEVSSDDAISLEEPELVAEDIFSLEGEEETAVEVELEEEEPAVLETIEPSEDQIREFRIEAGVFMKYGLLEKAADRLKSILVINQDDDAALEKLTEVYEKMGQVDQVVETMLQRADLANRASDQKLAKQILNQAVELAPGNQEVLDRLDNLGVKAEEKVAAGPAMGDDVPLVDTSGVSDFEPLYVPEPEEGVSVEGGDMAALVDLDEAGDAEEDAAAPVEAATNLSNGLSDVVREFREELVSRATDRDVDTHYNLGIAYKEMGLIEEAIEEFKLTIDFPSHAIKASDLLAQCYIETGNHQKADSVLNKALKGTSLTDNEILTLKYDLGISKKLAGELEQAKEIFDEIQILKKDYRDVGELLKDLG